MFNFLLRNINSCILEISKLFWSIGIRFNLLPLLKNEVVVEKEKKIMVKKNKITRSHNVAIKKKIKATKETKSTSEETQVEEKKVKVEYVKVSKQTTMVAPQGVEAAKVEPRKVPSVATVTIVPQGVEATKVEPRKVETATVVPQVVEAAKVEPPRKVETVMVVPQVVEAAKVEPPRKVETECTLNDETVAEEQSEISQQEEEKVASIQLLVQKCISWQKTRSPHFKQLLTIRVSGQNKYSKSSGKVSGLFHSFPVPKEEREKSYFWENEETDLNVIMKLSAAVRRQLPPNDEEEEEEEESESVKRENIANQQKELATLPDFIYIKLQTLSLDSCSFELLTDEVLYDAICTSRLTDLHTISVKHCNGLTTRAFRNIFRIYGTQLISLSLCTDAAYAPAVWKELLLLASPSSYEMYKFTKLHTLEYTFSHAQSMDGIIEKMKQIEIILPSLRVLTLADMTLSTRQCVVMIRCFKNLHEVSLKNVIINDTFNHSQAKEQKKNYAILGNDQIRKLTDLKLFEVRAA